EPEAAARKLAQASPELPANCGLEAAAKAKAQPATEAPATVKPQRKTKAQPSAEDSMARYNELLASYFARGNASKEEDKSAKSDPPSFKEWMEQGKPDF